MRNSAGSVGARVAVVGSTGLGFAGVVKSKLTLRVAGLGLVWVALGGCGSPTEAKSPDEPDPSALLGDEGNSGQTDAVVPASSPEVNKAMDAISAEDFASAKSILEPVVAKDASDVQAVFYLGVAEAGLNEVEPAITHFKRALELDPKFGDASLNLSALLLDLERFDEAIAVVDSALVHAPGDLGLIQNKALALSYGGKFADAVSPLRTLLEKKPTEEGMRFLLAEALFTTGDTAAAQTELGKLKSSSSAEVLASIADLYARLKQWDDCVAALDAATQKKPVAELFITRGLCKHGKSDDKGARGDFEKALDVDPKSAKAQFYLAHNLKESGDKKAAKAAFLKVVELAGSGPLAEKAKAAAAKL